MNKINEYIRDNIDIDIVGAIQVGANDAQELGDLKKLGIKNILLYEPLSSKRNIINEKIQNDPDVLFRPVGCGSENKSVKINIASNGGQSSSILKPKGHLKMYPSVKFKNQENIKIVRLDDDVKEKEKYNFLMIDVQGYEYEVLKGAEELLKNNIELLLLEVNSSELYENCILIDELEEYLSFFNFERIYSIREIEDMKKKCKWTDALYIKKSK